MTKVMRQGWWLCNGSAVTVRGSEHAVAAQSAVKLLRSWGVQRSKQTCANTKQQALVPKSLTGRLTYTPQNRPTLQNTCRE
ncbi:hypothetical protein COP2_003703 [Malus domestica]